MSEWGKARKKPMVVEYREVQPTPVLGQLVEEIETREEVLFAWPGQDYVIKGVRGEIYPIGIDIFNETYDVIEEPQSSNQTAKASEDG